MVYEISLRPLDVGFDLRVTGRRVVLPPAETHLRVIADERVYEGTTTDVLAAMLADGWDAIEDDLEEKEAQGE